MAHRSSAALLLTLLTLPALSAAAPRPNSQPIRTSPKTSPPGPSSTPSFSVTPTPTASSTPAASESSTPSISPTPAASESSTPSISPTQAASESSTPSISPTQASSESSTLSVSPTPSISESAEPSVSPTSAASQSSTPSASATITVTPTPSSAVSQLSTPSPFFRTPVLHYKGALVCKSGNSVYELGIVDQANELHIALFAKTLRIANKWLACVKADNTTVSREEYLHFVHDNCVGEEPKSCKVNNLSKQDCNCKRPDRCMFRKYADALRRCNEADYGSRSVSE